MSFATITERQIIELRDSMTVEQLRGFTNETMRIYGFVDLRYIIKTMGFVYAFNDKYHNSSEVSSKEFAS